ncbi:hypothetical protein A2364_02910 [candidate division WWE3 bacterium RIFOXYB1_FULL_43_12]|nr:MAG: hypothetical protein A2364_02910 [candidate division WWE3 bacterium RIFOXYB1_FULL_43_12]
MSGLLQWLGADAAFGYAKQLSPSLMFPPTDLSINNISKFLAASIYCWGIESNNATELWSTTIGLLEVDACKTS